MPILAILTAVRRYWKVGVFVALLLAIGVQTWRVSSLKADVETARDKTAATQAAFDTTVANYRAAAERARAADAANVARVKAEQDTITKEIVDDFQTRLADARARAERLRTAAAATDSSGGRDAPVPAPSAATGGTGQATGQGGLSGADALIATENSLQLMALIDWVEAQSRVEN